MRNLKIDLLSKTDEQGFDPAKSITLLEFLDLLRTEEDYYEGEQHNTKLMISRLRKIFYDKLGWDKFIIRGAKNVKTRYITKIVIGENDDGYETHYFKKNQAVSRYRIVTYSDHDRVYGASRAGEVPPIYKKEVQVVRIPDDYFYHVAHVLGVLDAWNYPQIVTPFPKFLSFLAKLGPHVNSNLSLVSWLDDLAQVATDFVYEYRRTKKPLSFAKEQELITKDSSGTDLLPDLDGYVIANQYNIGSENGKRVTDILKDFYYNPKSEDVRNNRFTIYARLLGLKDWDGHQFSNEKEWIKSYCKQLRDCTCFQIFSVTDGKFHSVWIPLLVWFNYYKKVIKSELLLGSYLEALKKQLKKKTDGLANGIQN